MKRLILALLITTAAMPAYADETNITDDGDGNKFYVTQINTGGAPNSIVINAATNHASYTATQNGRGNSATVNTYAWSPSGSWGPSEGNVYNTAQTGDYNTTNIDGDSSRVDVVVNLATKGSNNFVTATQSADHSTLNASVTGDTNQLTLQQGSRYYTPVDELANMRMNVVVDGTNNTAKVEQYGRNSNIDIYQAGTGNYIGRLNLSGAPYGTPDNATTFVNHNGNTQLRQIGNGNIMSDWHEPSIENLGYNNAVNLLQNGNDNTMVLGNAGSNNIFSASVYGSNNLTTVGTNGYNTDSTATITIVGANNGAFSGIVNPPWLTSSHSSGNKTGVEITGNNNSGEAAISSGDVQSNNNDVRVRIDGDYNYATASVTGNDNILLAEQTGTSNVAFLNAMGNDNIQSLLQNGTNNYSYTLAAGDENSILMQQLGDNNNANLQQYGNNNTIKGLQKGTDHFAKVTQIGDGHKFSFRQTGTGGYINITQQ